MTFGEKKIKLFSDKIGRDNLGNKGIIDFIVGKKYQWIGDNFDESVTKHTKWFIYQVKK